MASFDTDVTLRVQVENLEQSVRKIKNAVKDIGGADTRARYVERKSKSIEEKKLLQLKERERLENDISREVYRRDQRAERAANRRIRGAEQLQRIRRKGITDELTTTAALERIDRRRRQISQGNLSQTQQAKANQVENRIANADGDPRILTKAASALGAISESQREIERSQSRQIEQQRKLGKANKRIKDLRAIGVTEGELQKTLKRRAEFTEAIGQKDAILSNRRQRQLDNEIKRLEEINELKLKAFKKPAKIESDPVRGYKDRPDTPAGRFEAAAKRQRERDALRRAQARSRTRLKQQNRIPELLAGSPGELEARKIKDNIDALGKGLKIYKQGLDSTGRSLKNFKQKLVDLKNETGKNIFKNLSFDKLFRDAEKFRRMGGEAFRMSDRITDPSRLLPSGQGKKGPSSNARYMKAIEEQKKIETKAAEDVAKAKIQQDAKVQAALEANNKRAKAMAEEGYQKALARSNADAKRMKEDIQGGAKAVRNYGQELGRVGKGIKRVKDQLKGIKDNSKLSRPTGASSPLPMFSSASITKQTNWYKAVNNLKDRNVDGERRLLDLNMAGVKADQIANKLRVAKNALLRDDLELAKKLTKEAEQQLKVEERALKKKSKGKGADAAEEADKPMTKKQRERARRKARTQAEIDAEEAQEERRQRKRKRRNRLSSALSGAVLGGGFPLLFGGPSVSAAGGAIGGALGGLIGGQNGAFAGGIALSAIGTLFDTAITKAKELGDALRDPTANFAQLAQSLAIVGTEANTLIKTLSELGLQEAAGAITKDLAESELQALGLDPEQFAKDTQRLENEVRRFQIVFAAFGAQFIDDIANIRKFVTNFLGGGATKLNGGDPRTAQNAVSGAVQTNQVIIAAKVAQEELIKNQRDNALFEQILARDTLQLRRDTRAELTGQLKVMKQRAEVQKLTNKLAFEENSARRILLENEKRLALIKLKQLEYERENARKKATFDIIKEAQAAERAILGLVNQLNNINLENTKKVLSDLATQTGALGDVYKRGFLPGLGTSTQTEVQDTKDIFEIRRRIADINKLNDLKQIASREAILQKKIAEFGFESEIYKKELERLELEKLIVEARREAVELQIRADEAASIAAETRYQNELKINALRERNAAEQQIRETDPRFNNQFLPSGLGFTADSTALEARQDAAFIERLRELQAELNSATAQLKVFEQQGVQGVSAQVDAQKKVVEQAQLQLDLHKELTPRLNAANLAQARYNEALLYTRTLADALTRGLRDVVTGAREFQEVVSDILLQISDIFLNKASEMIAKYAAEGITNLLTDASKTAAQQGVKALTEAGTDALKEGTEAAAMGAAIAAANAPLIASNTALTAVVTANTAAVQANTIAQAIPRALGGPVKAGQPYLVGEVGPEIIVPQTSGTVVPNNRVMAALEDMAEPRMSGGAVAANQPYKVGEAGAELYIPENPYDTARSAMVVSNQTVTTKSQEKKEEKAIEEMQTSLDRDVNVRYESTVINNQTYVTEEQFQAGIKSGVKAARAETMKQLRNRPAVRSKAGIA